MKVFPEKEIPLRSSATMVEVNTLILTIIAFSGKEEVVKPVVVNPKKLLCEVAF